MSAIFRDHPTAAPAAVRDASRPEPTGRRARTASLVDPPPPGDDLAIVEVSLPSGDPLSTQARVEEGLWDHVIWGGGSYPDDLLADTDLLR